jgi:hypothetical protein
LLFVSVRPGGTLFCCCVFQAAVVSQAGMPALRVAGGGDAECGDGRRICAGAGRGAAVAGGTRAAS